MKNHSKFIKKPASELLEEVVAASSVLGCNINISPLWEYIMQAAFLQSTGFQEQKMKCILWELASNDYEYRRVLLENKDNLGECSTYKDKNTVYKRIKEQITKYNSTFDFRSMDKESILSYAKDEVFRIFEGTNLCFHVKSTFNEFKEDQNLISLRHFLHSENNLFESSLQDKYTLLYNHRNRCAHNTQSYQENLPTLDTLMDDDYKYDNYFVRFTILILIDTIFRELYDVYLEALKDKI